MIKLLQTGPMNETERCTFEHLERYLKFLEANIGVFLQFLTGRDVLVSKNINVTFNCLDGLQHRPMAHTCGSLLELPSTYQTFNELAEEITFILREHFAWSFNVA